MKRTNHNATRRYVSVSSATSARLVAFARAAGKSPRQVIEPRLWAMLDAQGVAEVRP